MDEINWIINSATMGKEGGIMLDIG